jgi:hypothetical protein
VNDRIDAFEVLAIGVDVGIDEIDLDDVVDVVRFAAVAQHEVIALVEHEQELAHAQQRSPTMPVKGLLFRENQLGPQGEYHTPRQRQFVITISGAVEITCAGGSRVFGPGDVLFAEDLKGEGHSNRELHGPRMSLIIQVTEDFDIGRFSKPR